MILKILFGVIKGFLLLSIGLLIALPFSMFFMYLTTVFSYYIVIIFFNNYR